MQSKTNKIPSSTFVIPENAEHVFKTIFLPHSLFLAFSLFLKVWFDKIGSIKLRRSVFYLISNHCAYIHSLITQLTITHYPS